MRHALAVRLRCGGAVVECEIEDVPFIGVGERGDPEEPLRFEHAQGPDQALAARCGQFVARCAFADDPRKRVEVERVLVRPADRFLEALRLHSRLRVVERGAQDVREPQHETAQLGLEATRLDSLCGAPGMRDKSGRHVAGAAEQLSVGGQGAAHLAQHLFQRFAFARTQRRRGLLPQLAERAGDTPLDGTRISSSSCSPWRRRRSPSTPRGGDVLEHRVDEAAQRAHELGPAFARFEHDRKVVAQGRELAVGRQHRRTQAEAFDRRQAVALAPAGEVKDQLVRGRLRFHRHSRSCRVGSGAAHAARVARASSSGQTVNLSSSRLRPERMYSGERNWPAWRRSS